VSLQAGIFVIPVFFGPRKWLLDFNAEAQLKQLDDPRAFSQQLQGEHLFNYLSEHTMPLP
jgi:hypothetical protein